MKKINISQNKSYILLAALALMMLPQTLFAGNPLMSSTGVSDESLFIILSTIAGFQLIAIIIIGNVIKSIASNHQIWSNHWKKTGTTIITLGLTLASGSLFAQEADFDALITMSDNAFIALLSLNAVLFLTFIYLVVKLNGLLKMLFQNQQGAVPESWLDKVNVMLTDAVPVEEEEDVMMDHEYDGIHELDNNLPPWWLYGFYLSIVFAFIYSGYYFIGDGPSSAQEYEMAMTEAEVAKAAFVSTQANTVDESNVEYLADASSLEAGGKLFRLNCAPCHGQTGGSMPGGVGPNLTDDYWINGGSVTDIFKTIKYGVPEKGMVSWEAQLSPSKIQQLSSYIKSVAGSNPENAKEPQGELYKEEVIEAAPETMESDSLTAEAEASVSLAE